MSGREQPVKQIIGLLDAPQRKAAFSARRAVQLLRQMTEQELIESVGMAELPLLAHLCRLKNGGDMHLIPIENDIMLRTGQCNLANMSYLAVTLHFVTIENGTLTLEGVTSFPTAVGDDAAFGLSVNGTFVPVETRDIGEDRALGGTVYEKRSAFTAVIPLGDDMQITFVNVTGGLHCRYGKINAQRFAPVADVIPDQYAEMDGYLLQIRQGQLFCCRSTPALRAQYEERYQNSLRAYDAENAQWAIDLRQEALRRREQKTKPVWLFMDRYDTAGDNAEALFRYVQQFEKIDSYFIVDESSPDFARMSKIGRTVGLYSREHFLLCLTADYMFSSQSNGVVENPFWEKAELLRDLYHRPKLVFLQHGYTKDDMSATLNRYNTNFAGLVTSGEREYRSFLNPVYHYSEKQIWLTGMPRLDLLENHTERVILLMPSWRKSLMHQQWDEQSQNMLWVPEENAQDSEYCRRYVQLLKNRALAAACRKYGYRVVFYAHPLAAGLMHSLLRDTGAEVWDGSVSYREAFSRAALMVTDYSSVAFDFAYLKKPVLYYQFDEKQFFRTHTYGKGYFDYRRDGFGPVCTRERELVAGIIRYLKNDMSPEPGYLEHMEKAYAFHDKNSCERVFRMLNKEP